MEVGYRGLSVDAIARSAGSNRAAVYRRWPSLPALVLDALATRLGEVRAPDTGCTICDLSDAIKLHLNIFRRLPPDSLASLLADCNATPALRETFMGSLFRPPRAAVAQVLDTAIARGDLREDTNRDLLLDLLASLVHYRALFAHAPTTDDDVEDAVHALLRGVAVDYEQLVAISKAKTGDPLIHHRHVGLESRDAAEPGSRTSAAVIDTASPPAVRNAGE
ncbi:TetR family transcriptional regulator [Nocardia sp. CT2-14]|uniref:TetR family transcriptional regulator n=2 Tax=Nocardia aurantiaca TaxID=2675850 RepID=A0A6I3L6U8_9NOCA|nr:TetR family transcriptional regulator [Nocardia aurantiaca]